MKVRLDTAMTAAPTLAQALQGMHKASPDCALGQCHAAPGAGSRYIPYWNRGSGKAAMEALVDYDKPGAGD